MENKINKPLRLAIFISGRGSNMNAIIDACEQDSFPAEIAVILSNNPNAKGLETAKKHSIPSLCINHKDFGTKAEFETAMINALQDYDFDLICLAGFMRVISKDFIDYYNGNIINIHPSLLPDYKGLNTHARVLADQKDKTGCTVHFVTPDIDSGKIIIQKQVSVLQNDTEDTLASRVLQQEHIAYPEAIKTIAKQRQDS